MRALLVGALLAVLAGPASATDCDVEGLKRTEELCAPGRNPLRCSKRVAHMEQECRERERDLADGEKTAKDPKRIEELKRKRAEMEQAKQATEKYDQQTPDYKSPEYNALEKRMRDQGQDPDGDQPPRERPPRGQGEGEQGGDAAQAQNALKSGDFAGAEEAATRAIHSDPENPAGWLTRAQARSLSGNKDGARLDAKQALALNPNPEQGAAAQYLLGSGGALDRAQSKIPKKLDFGSRAPDLGQGGGRPGHGGLRPLERSFDSAAGEAPEGGGSSGNAARAYDPAQAAALAAALPGAAGLKNESADRAFGKLRLRDYPGALEEADKAVAEKPNDPRARTIRAAVHNRMGSHDLAEADATAALSLKPKDVTALLERGYARYKLGRYSQALEDVDEALSIDPLNAMGYLYKGMILEKLQRVGESVGFYRKAGELDPGLKPVADEAEARLTGKPAAAPAAPSLVQRLASRWKYWLLLVVAAGLLLARGMRRAVKPEWATPLTPIR